MWFIFGFITLFSFLVFFLVKLKDNNWGYTKNKYKNKEYIIGSEIAKKGFFLGCLNNQDLGLNFSIKKETSFDKIFKGFGISIECQVDHQEFNDTFYIISDDERVCKLLKNDQKLHESFLKLFSTLSIKNFNVNGFFYKGDKMWLHLENDENLNQKEEILPILFELNELLNNKLEEIAKIKAKDNFTFKASLLLSLSTAMAITGFVFFYMSNSFVIEKWLLVKLSFVIGAVITLSLCAFAISILGKSSRTHLILIEFVTIGYLGATGSSHYLLKKINIEFDTSIAYHYNSKVIEKSTSKSRKGPTHYYLYLYNASKNRKYEVPYSIYSKLEVNDQVDVSVKNGLLGFKWIEDIQKRF